jgi:hypothetical protein
LECPYCHHSVSASKTIPNRTSISTKPKLQSRIPLNPRPNLLDPEPSIPPAGDSDYEGQSPKELPKFYPEDMTDRGGALMRPIPKKSQVLAFFLGLIFGPIGFFYVGWRYGVAAVCFFLILIAIVKIPAMGMLIEFAASDWVWGTLHGLVIGVFASIAIDDQNKNDAKGFEDTITMEFALLCAAGAYKIVMEVAFGLAGIIIAVKMMSDGRIAVGLFLLFIGVPIIAMVAALVQWASIFIVLILFSLLKNVYSRDPML